ncbi:MAG: hypothetical protein CL746_06605 [Chloroflexi bacterium]|nr:hypothetical protein [Chloroflexota bacterium]
MNKVTDLFPDKEPKKEKQIKLEELLESCLHCDFELKSSKIYQRYRICPNCNYHFSISARRRLATLIDKNSFNETSKWVQSLDPIEFSPRISYRVRLVQDKIRTGLNEAIITGTCRIDDREVVMIVIDSSFLGGSMGVVVGEKVTLALELAKRKKIPCICAVSSSGTRLQEGVFSLLQMAKTSFAVRSLKDANIPFITILSNPTTGQIFSSFASLSDIIISEPNAQIGFSSLGEITEFDKNKKNYPHTSETFIKFGQIDKILNRNKIKTNLSLLLDLLSPNHTVSSIKIRKENIKKNLPYKSPEEIIKLSRNKNRPKSRYYIENIFTNFFELHGDRISYDDQSIITGIGKISGISVMIIAQEKSEKNIKRKSSSGAQSGEITPSGFRKATRAINLAELFKIPLVSFVDTPGPALGMEMEKLGLSNSVSNMIDQIGKVNTPSISLIIGEGGSEAALAFSITDKVLMLENAIYTPIIPEKGAKTEMKDQNKISEIAESLKLTASDCLDSGIIDKIISEPRDGAHSNPSETSKLLKITLSNELFAINKIHIKTLRNRRKKKYRNIGEFGSKFLQTVKTESKIFQAGIKASIKALREN